MMEELCPLPDAIIKEILVLADAPFVCRADREEWRTGRLLRPLFIMTLLNQVAGHFMMRPRSEQYSILQYEIKYLLDEHRPYRSLTERMVQPMPFYVFQFTEGRAVTKEDGLVAEQKPWLIAHEAEKMHYKRKAAIMYILETLFGEWSDWNKKMEYGLPGAVKLRVNEAPFACHYNSVTKRLTFYGNHRLPERIKELFEPIPGCEAQVERNFYFRVNYGFTGTGELVTTIIADIHETNISL